MQTTFATQKIIALICSATLFFGPIAQAENENSEKSTPSDIATYFSQMREQKQKVDPSKTVSFTLPNQLRVQLISDPKATKSGAGFSVNVGLTSDPLPYRGLAHYLEHMLFLGSEKYPTPAEFQKFTEANGGNSNAYTSNVETNYHFMVNNDALEEALERMTQFFVKPLFDQGSMDKEINAIQSEYDKNLDSNQWRYQYIRQFKYTDNHPQRWNFQGNKETLGNVPREVMLNFFNSHYSSNMMNVVIVSSLPITDLKAMAEKTLTQIPNRQAIAPQIPTITSAYLSTPSTLYEIASVTDTPQIRIDFVLPPESSDYWQIKSYDLLTSWLDSNDSKALSQRLKDKGLINKINSYYYSENDVAPALSLIIDLTPSGEKVWSKVAQSALKTLKDIIGQGYQDIIFKNQKRMFELNYLFSDSDDPMSTASQMASINRKSSSNDNLERLALISSSSPRVYIQDLNKIDFSKVYIYRFSKSVVGNTSADFYKMSYATTPVADLEWYKNLSTAESFVAQPKVNSYLPQDLSIISEANDQERTPLVSNSSLQASLLRNTEFSRPVTAINLEWTAATDYIKNDKDRVLNELFTQYIDESLKSWAGPASEAMYEYKWTNFSLGQQLTIKGFSDKISQFTMDLMGQALNQPIDPILFARIQQRQVLDLDNLDKKDALQQAIWYLRKLSNANTAAANGLKETIQSLSPNDLHLFRENLIKKSFVRLLIFGNVTQSQGQELATKISGLLSTNTSAKMMPYALVKYPNATSAFLVKRAGLNNAWFADLQLGDLSSDIKTQALSQLLGQIISAPFYSYMRTDKQLGYIVSAQSASPYLNPGLQLVVQSQVSAIQVADIGRKWLSQFANELLKLPKSDFDDYKSALVESLNQPSINFQDKNDSVKKLFYYNKPDNFNKLLAEQVKAITLEELIAFYNSRIIGSEKRELSVYVQSTQAQKPDFNIPSQEQLIFHDIETFRATTERL